MCCGAARLTSSSLFPRQFYPLLTFVVWLAGCAGGPDRMTDRVPLYAGYPLGYTQQGMASWYGPGFHGKRTANGERYDMHQMTAAHRTLPIGSVARVRSVDSDRSVTVRINDRGPFAKDRIVDVSYAAAQHLGMLGPGTLEVELQVIGYQGRAGALGYLCVQVGSFAQEVNARQLVARLRGRYRDVRMATVYLSGGRRFRVQVGRYVSEAEAQTVADHLSSELSVDALVLRDDA
jgi:rare lipoprotein A